MAAALQPARAAALVAAAMTTTTTTPTGEALPWLLLPAEAACRGLQSRAWLLLLLLLPTTPTRLLQQSRRQRL
jgi:hypothetical protein